MAKLGIVDIPLMEAISSAARRRLTEFEAFDISILLWAYDILNLGSLLELLIPGALRHFYRDELWIEKEHGMFWFDFANVVGARTTYEERANFESKFEQTILNPATHCLTELASTEPDHATTLKIWQERVDSWQIPYLGPIYSSVVLSQFGVRVF